VKGNGEGPMQPTGSSRSDAVALPARWIREGEKTMMIQSAA
jgi:hypothetical protein